MTGSPVDAVSLLVLGVAAGTVAGAVFFGGLAWTLRRLPHARSPGLLVAASLVVRLAVVAGAAVVVVQRGLVAAAGLLASVLVVRTLVVRRLAPDDGGR